MHDKLSVLRACYEVLAPRGRIAGYTIHTPAGLSSADARRAQVFGPSEVLADASHPELLAAAGFEVIVDEDATTAFHSACGALLRARSELQDELRETEGEHLYEEEQHKKSLMLEGITHGLLVRSLHVARKPVPTGR